jgi:hypothetical protein
MSSAGGKRSFLQAMRHVYAMGGLRAYYRGLTVSSDVDIALFTFQRHMNESTLL